MFKKEVLYHMTIQGTIVSFLFMMISLLFI